MTSTIYFHTMARSKQESFYINVDENRNATAQESVEERCVQIKYKRGGKHKNQATKTSVEEAGGIMLIEELDRVAHCVPKMKMFFTEALILFGYALCH